MPDTEDGSAGAAHTLALQAVSATETSAWEDFVSAQPNKLIKTLRNTFLWLRKFSPTSALRLQIVLEDSLQTLLTISLSVIPMIKISVNWRLSGTSLTMNSDTSISWMPLWERVVFQRLGLQTLAEMEDPISVTILKNASSGATLLEALVLDLPPMWVVCNPYFNQLFSMLSFGPRHLVSQTVAVQEAVNLASELIRCVKEIAILLSKSALLPRLASGTTSWLRPWLIMPIHPFDTFHNI